MGEDLIKQNLQYAKQAALRSSRAPHRRAGKKARRDGGDDDDAPPKKKEVRLLTKPEVIDRVGRSFPCIWAWMREGFFPRARELDGRPVWIESEVEAFIKNLPVRPYLGDNGYDPPPQVKARFRRAAKTRAA